MAFPQSVLPVRVRVALDGKPAADPATWNWVDATNWVRVASGITIDEGRPDEAARVDPGKLALTVDNRDGRWSTMNVLGAWYGRLRKGTPIRVGTIAVADTFSRTASNGWGTSDSGQGWGVTGTTSDYSVSPSGGGQVLIQAANTVRLTLTTLTELLDVDSRLTVSVPEVMTGGSMVTGVVLRYVDASNYYVMACEFNTGGTITAKIRKFVGGAMTEMAVYNAIPGFSYTGGQKYSVRAQADGPALRIKVWPAANAEPAAWTLTTADTSITSAGRFGTYMWCVSGNSNTKPFAVSFDDVEAESVEYTGTIRKLPPRWDKSRTDKTALLTAAGILARLQQGKTPLRSPLARMLLRNNPVAAWMLDDAGGSTALAPAVPRVLPGTVRAVELGQEEPRLFGAKQTAGFTASTVLTGRIPGHTATGNWGFVFIAYLVAPPAANTRIMQVASTGTVRTWAVELDSVAMWLRGYDSDGTQIVQTGVSYNSDVKLPGWIAFDMLIKQASGIVTAKLLTYGITGDASSPSMWTNTTTISGTAGSPQAWRSEGSLGFNEGRLGPVSVFNYEPPFVTYAFANAANGYNGERAADRVNRLCAEEKVQIVVEDGLSEEMGFQRTDTFLNLLYSCEDADLGILYERGAGLGYRPRYARFNRPVELALDFANGDVAEPPEPNDEDPEQVNKITVTRDGGSSAIAQDDDAIDENGLIDSTTTLNLYRDDVLDDHANFRLQLGLVSRTEYLWPEIMLNLARNVGQIRRWRAAQPWPRLTIANEPGEVAGNAVDVTALGHKITMGPYDWQIALNCAPTRPWLVGVYGTSRQDSATTKITGALAATAGTGITIGLSTTDPTDVWSTTATGYPVKVAGEIMTVTGMTAPTGSGPYLQTATVTRAGPTVKAHIAGEKFSLAEPARSALGEGGSMAAGDIIMAGDIAKAVSRRIGTIPSTTDAAATSGTTESVVDTLTVSVVAGRRYRLQSYFPFTGTVAADRFLLRLREGTTNSGVQITYATGVVAAVGAVLIETPEADWTAAATGTQSFSVTAARTTGTGTLTPKGSPGQPRILSLDYVDG